MKKTLIFLLTLSLTLSGAIIDKHEMTLRHIIQDLLKINKSTPPIKFSQEDSHKMCKKNWTCTTSREFWKELNVVLHKVKADEVSQSIYATLKTIQQNLKIVEDYSLQGQSVMRGKCRQSRRSCESPLECGIKILQWLNRNCSAPSTQR